MESTNGTRRDLLRMLTALGIVAGTPDLAMAAPQPGVAPTDDTVVDNEKVRVFRRTAGPGQDLYRAVPHPHAPQLMVLFTDAKLKVAETAKPLQRVDYKAGDWWWDSGTVVSVHNAGTRDMTAFLVEPKGSVTAAKAAPDRVQWKRTPVLAGGRILFENDMLRVVEHAAKPRMGVCGEGMHSHPPHLTIALTDARMRITLPDREPVIREGKAGHVFWDESGPHAIQNLGSRNTRAFLIEIKTI